MVKILLLLAKALLKQGMTGSDERLTDIVGLNCIAATDRQESSNCPQLTRLFCNV